MEADSNYGMSSEISISNDSSQASTVDRPFQRPATSPISKPYTDSQTDSIPIESTAIGLDTLAYDSGKYDIYGSPKHLSSSSPHVLAPQAGQQSRKTTWSVYRTTTTGIQEPQRVSKTGIRLQQQMRPGEFNASGHFKTDTEFSTQSTDIIQKKRPYFRPINTVTKGRNTTFVDRIDYRVKGSSRTNPRYAMATNKTTTDPNNTEKKSNGNEHSTVWNRIVSKFPSLRETQKSPEVNVQYVFDQINYTLPFFRVLVAVAVMLYIFYIFFMLLTYDGLLPRIIFPNFDYENPTYFWLVFGFVCASTCLLTLVLFTVRLQPGETLDIATFQRIACVVIIAFSFLVTEGMFTKQIGPSMYLFIVLMGIYIAPLIYPRTTVSAAIALSFLDLPVSIIRYYIRPDAPNYKTSCLQSHMISSPSDPNCAQQIVANTLIYLCIHVFGVISVFYLYRHSRKLYFKEMELEIEVEKYNEIAEEASRVAMSLLPKKVWEDMRGTRRGPYAISNLLKEGKLLYKYENVTILFGDVVGFTQLSSVVSAQKLVRILDSIFTAFDEITEHYGLEKIKTIGDAYMICAGVPEPVKDAEVKMIKMAKNMISIIDKTSEQNGLRLQIRIGIHHGTAWGGVQGIERLIFDVWSRDVSIASMMEQTGRPSKIHVSEPIYRKTKNHYRYIDGEVVEYKGESIKTYYLDTSVRTLNAHEISVIIPSMLKSNPKLNEGNNSEDSNDPFMKSNTELAKEFVESELHAIDDASMKERLSSLNYWTNRFADDMLEEEYQKQYVQRSPFHTFLSVFSCFLVAVLYIPIDYLIYNDHVLPLCNLVVAAIIGILCYLIIRPVLKDSATQFTDILDQQNKANGQMKKSQPVLQSVESLVNESSVTFVHRNIQIIAPSILLLMYLSTLFAFIKPNNLTSNYNYVRAFVIKMQAIVFPRISYLNLTSCCILITFTQYIFFLFPPSSKLSIAYISDGYSAIGFDLVIILMVAWATRSTERHLRVDFLNDREWHRQRYRTSEISAKTTDLLNKLVPLDVVQRLKENPKSVIADFIEEGAILFAEVKVPEFTDSQSELDNIKLMNEIFTAFDKILIFHHVEKIKSIGNIYIVMAYGDLDNDMMVNDSDELRASYYTRIANFAIGIRRTINTIAESKRLNIKFKIGINVGNVVAGVIGKKKIAYDVWGDTVNVASRMTSSAPEGQIQITEECANLLKNSYEIKERGLVQIKGKGEMKTFYLMDKKKS